ncbi:troponin fast skeletal muscle-like isoform X2 [Labeo rohita]|uniref:Troponin fast skeletal muscle-like isoform X2 n=3 Tax=Labeonini TaxID=2743697 RepID=A0A498MK18_LABRO|nr:troponin fast skeletal muscle-like isoform X2 [Labeo rohita]
MVFVTFQYRHDAENALKAVNCLELLDKPVGNTWAHYITIKSIVKDIDNHAIHNVFLRFGNVLSLEVVNDMIELTENNEAKMKFMRKKMSSSRRQHLKSLLLQIAHGLLEEEAAEAEQEKQRYMEENCPALSMPGNMQELQELCRKLHQQIDVVDEQRYDMESKVAKSNKEVEDLKIKVQDLKGKFKKPVLKKVRMSADAMLQALLGSKHKVSLDLRANLKQVKKEVKEEEKESVGDWRKNIEDKAGMDGRKKMFESEA